MQVVRPALVAKCYGLWVALCLAGQAVGELTTGNSEIGIAVHVYLIITGLPLSLGSLQVIPNGSLLASGVAGAIGLLQWWGVARLTEWEDGRKNCRADREAKAKGRSETQT